MATRFAIANGNWNTGATWDNGSVPVAGDTVYPNNYTVTLDQDIDVASLNNNLSPVYLPNMAIPLMTSLNQPSGVAFGNQNLAGYDPSKAFDQNTSTYYSSGTPAGFIGYQFPTSQKIIKQYRFIPLTNFQARDWTFQGSNDGINYTTLHTVTSYASGTYNSGVISNTTAYFYYRINVTATTNGNGCNFTSVEMTESTALVYGNSSGGSFTVPASLSGIRNIVQTGEGIKSNNGSQGVVNVNAISGATVNFNISSGGYIFNPTWLTTATNNTKGVAINGNCAVNFNGNIFGQTGVGIYNDTSAGQIYINAAATVTINGNVYSPPGAGGSFTYQIHLATSTSNAAILNINGDVISSNLSGYTYPIYLNSLATVNIVGNLTSVVGYCLISTTGSTVNLTGTATVTNANSLPAIYMTQQNVTPQTSLLTINGIITNKNNSNAIIASKIRFASTATPYWIYQTNAGTDMTLSYGSAIGEFPIEADVRAGVQYAAAPIRTGTCAVPLPQYVSQGVATGSTVGTAYMDPESFLNAISTSSNVIATRLKNVSTVQTTGDQMSSFNV